MRCPHCQSTSVSRVGNPLSRAWRRLFRRNLYVCHGCQRSWSSHEFDPSVRILASLKIRILKKP